MKVFLIRHGETFHSIGKGGPDLTPKGKKQIDALAKRFKNASLDCIISSDLERALVTAKEILKYNKGVRFEVSEELREIYRKVIGGPEKEGEDPKRYERDLVRANKLWGEINSYKFERVMLVCHGNLIKFLLGRALNVSSEGFYYSLDIHPASVSILEIKDNEVKVLLINDIGHIPKKLLSNHRMIKQ